MTALGTRTLEIEFPILADSGDGATNSTGRSVPHNARHERGAAGMPAQHDDASRRLRSMPLLCGTPLQAPSAAQISTDLPVKLRIPRKVKLEGSSVKIKRPMYSVVAGPGGLSVGKKIRSSCPVVTQV